MESEPILKKTLVTVGAMVGAWIAFVGSVSLVAVVVTSHVVGASDSSERETSGAATAPVPGIGARPDTIRSPNAPRPTPNSPNSHRAAHDTI
jgi:hypothetical protein